MFAPSRSCRFSIETNSRLDVSSLLASDFRTDGQAASSTLRNRARVIEQSWEDCPFNRSGPTTRSNYQTDYRTASVQKCQVCTRSLLNPRPRRGPPTATCKIEQPDEHFFRVPRCRRRLRADTEFEGRNSCRRLYRHADAHPATRRQIAPSKPEPEPPCDPTPVAR